MSALGFPSEAAARELMLQLISDALVRDSRQVCYILDDLHFIASPRLPELLTFICSHLPEQLHLVLLSRNEIFGTQEDFRLGSRRYIISANDLRLSEKGLLTYARH